MHYLPPNLNKPLAICFFICYNIIEELFVDDAVDLLDELPAIVVKKILQNAKPETRNILNQFLNYAEDSAGSIMTSEYIALKKDITIEQAIKRIRTVAKDKEEIYKIIKGIKV